MTISQSSSNCTSSAGLVGAGARSPFLAIPLALVRRFAEWQDRRRAAAELARLAAIGDYLLRDIGLDPGTARSNRAAMLEYLLRRR